MFKTRALMVLYAGLVLAAGLGQSQNVASNSEAQAEVAGTWQGRTAAVNRRHR